MADFRVGFCISGQGRLFRAAALHARELGIQPALVVVGQKAAAELEQFCSDLTIPFVRLTEADRHRFDEVITRLCVSAQLDLLSLTFDRLLPKALVDHYQGRIVNVHPGLLPAFKGLKAMEQATDTDVRFAGATMHVVDDQLDHGPIVSQCVLGVRKDETPQSLGRRLFGLLLPMYLQVVAWYADGRVTLDGRGRVRVRDAIYGELPISPSIERAPWMSRIEEEVMSV